MHKHTMVPGEFYSLIRRKIHWLAIMLTLLWHAYSFATTQVQVLETFPPDTTITLGNSQHFYLHLHYETDVPVQIWALPYFHGKPAHAGNSPSLVYPAGSGDALGWFFLDNPGDQVDEVRITAGDGSFGNTPVVATLPVHITAGSQSVKVTDLPDWVTTLEARATAADREAYKKAMSRPISTGEIFLFNGFMLAVLGLGILGVAAPIWALRRWHGGWRMAAAVPTAIMGFVVLRFIVDVSSDPTSHNLWPFELMMTSLLNLGVMAVLLIARRVMGVGRE